MNARAQRESGFPRRGSATPRRGSATLVAVITLVAISSLAAVVLSVSYRSSLEASAAVDGSRAFFAAQAGIHDALTALEGVGQGAVGDANAPVLFTGGTYWVEADDDGEGFVTLTSHARMGFQRRTLEVVVEEQRGGPFHNGIFAGNSSEDPGYSLPLGGVGLQADQIRGDVYSGGDVTISGDAEVEGTVRARGSVRGSGAQDVETGREQPIPDLAGMNYSATADVKVGELFASATYESDDAGGSAWQLPEDSPAHIFRKNPSDRASDTLLTAGDDYFLEDPYEPVNVDSDLDGSDPYPLTLSGVSGEPGSSSNHKVFFIEGNLWLHNKKSFSFEFSHGEPNGVQVTFVVQGNIYLSDNLFYEEPAKDGVAFIAMRDPARPDSGNIYLGDPVFGTLKRMYAYLYAENDFYDFNLDETGSTTVELFGNMTAGDQIVINRDYEKVVDGVDVTGHTRLMIDFDERVANGELDLPGLPGRRPGQEDELVIRSWRGVALD